MNIGLGSGDEVTIKTVFGMLIVRVTAVSMQAEVVTRKERAKITVKQELVDVEKR